MTNDEKYPQWCTVTKTPEDQRNKPSLAEIDEMVIACLQNETEFTESGDALVVADGLTALDKSGYIEIKVYRKEATLRLTPEQIKQMLAQQKENVRKTFDPENIVEEECGCLCFADMRGTGAIALCVEHFEENSIDKLYNPPIRWILTEK